MISAFIFDLDGTLANTALIHKEAWEIGLKRLEIKNDVKIDYLLGRKTSDIAKLLGGEKWKELMEIKNEEYLRLVEIKAEPNECAKELVSTLMSKGVRVAIVTSSNGVSARKVLDKIGVKYHVLITSDDVVKGKPDPESIVIALNKLNVKPMESIGIGDTEIDVEAYYSAGLRGIYLLRSGVPFNEEKVRERNAVIISSLCELFELIS
ncbi:HAD family hydrolase [Stygiolobus caldivivus]|uniref:Phosphatase n=1 Tax=Stygiolobus caldivivus TaxID=2824673 RepID=A0A8D5U4M8_9CREN|nr:HAD family phosphatase [Stygiolobus caldivivus]BCU69183.1 phosphatase [Stygiolobus caldivivus]